MRKARTAACPRSRPRAQAGIVGLCCEQGPAVPQGRHVRLWVLADPTPTVGHTAPPVPSPLAFLPLKHLGQNVWTVRGTNPAAFSPADRMVSASSATRELVPVLSQLHRVSHPLSPLGPTGPPVELIPPPCRGCPVAGGCAEWLSALAPARGAAPSQLHCCGWSQVLLKHTSPQLWHPHQQGWT